MPTIKLRGSRAACEQVYEDFRPVIENIAAVYARRFRQDYDEALADANLIFLKAYHGHDPERSEIGGRIVFLVYRGLLTNVRRAVARARIRFERITYRTPARRHREIRLPELPPDEDVRRFVRALVEPDPELVELATEVPNAGKLRGRVLRTFRRRGWSYARLRKVLDEIESAV